MLKIMIAKTWPLENKFSTKIFLYIYSLVSNIFLTFVLKYFISNANPNKAGKENLFKQNN